MQLVVYNWFVGPEHGVLRMIVQALDQQSAYNLYELVNAMRVSREKIKDIYSYELQRNCKSTEEYFKTVLELMPYFKLDPKALESGLVKWLIDLGAREAEPNGGNARSVSIVLLAEIWLDYTAYVDSLPGTSDLILQLMRKAIKEPKHTVLKATTLMSMFRVLGVFGVTKNRSAPIVYRTLVFNAIENCHDDVPREMNLSLFKDLYVAQPQVPVDLIVDPLCKLLMSEDAFRLRAFDFEFIGVLTKHHKLGL